MKTTLPKDPGPNRAWLVIDATDKPLGRLAVRVANLLRGKTKVEFSPQVDVGDFVVVVNASKVKLTGRKGATKMYKRYTGYRDGLKLTPAAEMRANKPDKMIELAVKRMLPKNNLSRAVLGRLNVYAGAEHPHAAQKPVAVQMA
jgi:large subunit ribosomal protein L13